MERMRKFIHGLGQPLAYVILPFALCLVAKADAQPKVVSEQEPATNELLARIHWLESRVQALETRVQELEHTHLGRASALSSNSDCSPPYTLDPQGLRRFIPECVGPSSSVSCEQPFTLDATGIKRVKLWCLPQ